MEDNKRKLFDSFASRTKIYLVIIFILFVIISIINIKLILPSIILYVLIIAYTYYADSIRKAELSEHLEELLINNDKSSKDILINSPFPLILVETDGNVIWKSFKFVTEFKNEDINFVIDDLVEDIKIGINKDEKNYKIELYTEIDEKKFKVVGEFIKDKQKNGQYVLMLYFIDETKNIKLQKEYNDSKSCVGILMIDNYEEAIQRVDTDEKPLLLADIEKSIYNWADQTNGIVIKSDRDRYVMIFEQRYIETIKEDKFSILDTIKEMTLDNKMQLTLSIAMSNEGNTDKEKYKSALAAMEIILGRGGDQAVIREDGKYIFYGGKVEEVEKRTKVKARIMAHALEELIKESRNVIVMGHINPDMDVIGSAMGIYRLVKSLNKEVNIVSNINGATLENFVYSLEKEEEYQDVIISKEEADQIVDCDTLIVIVDTHKVNYVEAPELLNKTGKIAIIDHHRRSADYIDKSILTFQEVYASSTAELVTELIQYAKSDIELSTIEAESLYAGIMMDTKNFTFKTGVRTFEAAAYLRKCGVDIIKVKKWFQSNLESYNNIAQIVKNAIILENTTIAISICELEGDNVPLICAKAADELLTIGNITASFVLGNFGDKIGISGRSIGDINVQLILEKLGGGGHITLAGAQVEGKSINEVKEVLIEKVNEYLNEIVE